MKRLVVLVAVLATVTVSAPAASAATDGVCGWSGSVSPLIAKADAKIARIDLASRARAYFGDGATVGEKNRQEVDLAARTVGATGPTDARGLTRNSVVYNMVVTSSDGVEHLASAQMRFEGLCFRAMVFVPQAWVGSTGAREPKIDVRKALRLAQDYRLGHSDRFPLDNPLHSVTLMQATTAPPDFGKLRWFVNYQVAPGVVQVLSVFMDGSVKVALG